MLNLDAHVVVHALGGELTAAEARDAESAASGGLTSDRKSVV